MVLSGLRVSCSFGRTVMVMVVLSFCALQPSLSRALYVVVVAGLTVRALLVDSGWWLAIHCMFLVLGLPPVVVARSWAVWPRQMVLSGFRVSCRGWYTVTIIWAVSVKKVLVSFSITLYCVVVVGLTLILSLLLIALGLPNLNHS